MASFRVDVSERESIFDGDAASETAWPAACFMQARHLGAKATLEDMRKQFESILRKGALIFREVRVIGVDTFPGVYDVHRRVRRPSMLLLAVLTCSLLTTLSAFPHVQAHSGVSLSGYTSVAPIIDGNVGANEWAPAATTETFTFTAGSQTIMGRLHMMNDATNLYVAVEIKGDDDFGTTDGFKVYFDNDHGGPYKTSVDDYLETGGASSFVDCFIVRDQSGELALLRDTDDLPPGTMDGKAAGSRQGITNQFELSHPLNSADDAHDFSLVARQTVGFAFEPKVDNVAYPLPGEGLGTAREPPTYGSDFANYVVAAPLSSVKGSVIDAAAGAVYFIYPDYDPTHAKPNGAAAAALSDFTALGVLYGMTVNVQSECLDTSPACVEQPIGRPSMTGKAVVLVGGQGVHASVRYYDNQRIAPVYPTVEGTMYYWYTRAGVKLTSTAFDSTLFGNGISYHQDMFVVEYFMDGNGNAVFIIYGYGWKGSFAGGRYFKSTIYPNIGTYAHAYYIYQWNDLNGNNDGFPDLNEMTLVTSGD